MTNREHAQAHFEALTVRGREKAFAAYNLPGKWAYAKSWSQIPADVQRGFAKQFTKSINP